MEVYSVLSAQVQQTVQNVFQDILLQELDVKSVLPPIVYHAFKQVLLFVLNVHRDITLKMELVPLAHLQIVKHVTQLHA